MDIFDPLKGYLINNNDVGAGRLSHGCTWGGSNDRILRGTLPIIIRIRADCVYRSNLMRLRNGGSFLL